ncbi:MAG: hypothetical protein R3C28_04245 [Pirellulaceae bacterium]
MSRTIREDTDPGFDSFLDIVANLVGILIILIMVIGVQTKDAVVSSQHVSATEVEDQALVEQVAVTTQEMNEVTRNVHEVDAQAKYLASTIEARRRERDQLNLFLLAAEQELDQERAKLDAEDQQRYDLQQNMQALQDELTETYRLTESLEAAESPTVELQHLPTPMAKTVFGKEEHFRLQDGRLVYVPLNALTDQLRSEAPKKLWKLKETNAITETIGPVQGFHLQYTLRRNTYSTNTQAGPVVRQVAELDRFILLPVSMELGEPLDAALSDGSQFRQVLASMPANSTVVTVWTYPESFGDFRQLKSWLYERGYATAARPLPDGQPISGSPDGTRSASQ